MESVKDHHSPGAGRYLIGLVGNGPVMEYLDRIFAREDFAFAFPRVKIAGWVPEEGGALEESAERPTFLRGQAVFPTVESLFAARPGIQLALDVSGDSRYAKVLRASAPADVTIVAPESALLFCAAAEDGRLAIGGGEGLRKARNMFGLLMDQTEDDIFILDAHGKILEMNRFAAESRGVARQDYLGRPCGDLDSSIPCCGEGGQCSYCNTRDTGKRSESLNTMVMPNGKIRHLHTVCFPVLDPLGIPSQFLFVRRDVTERQQMEQRLQQAEKMAAIGELSTYMAHEIRNPLFSIGGFANALLRNSALDENAREKARIIFEESRRLDVILTNILNFARPTDQELGVFDVEPVIRQTMSLMTMGSGERGIKADTVIEPGLPKVQGNAENLKQCLINLVKNAMEAMPDGGIVTVRAKRNDGTVRIEVEDTGGGIAPEIQDQVFSPFFSTKHEGAGLGLAMTRKVIEEMGGKVLLRSTLGRGSTITLVLPAALAVEG